MRKLAGNEIKVRGGFNTQFPGGSGKGNGGSTTQKRKVLAIAIHGKADPARCENWRIKPSMI